MNLFYLHPERESVKVGLAGAPGVDGYDVDKLPAVLHHANLFPQKKYFKNVSYFCFFTCLYMNFSSTELWRMSSGAQNFENGRVADSMPL